MGDKVTDGQTKRVALDLTDSNLTPADILKQIEDWPGDVAGLEDLIIVDGGKVVAGWSP